MDEFTDLQLASLDELPSRTDIDIWGEGINRTFQYAFEISSPSKFVKACLVLPVSNADNERIFSMLKKIQTDNRSELSNNTICSLICAKQN